MSVRLPLYITYIVGFFQCQDLHDECFHFIPDWLLICEEDIFNMPIKILSINTHFQKFQHLRAGIWWKACRALPQTDCWFCHPSPPCKISLFLNECVLSEQAGGLLPLNATFHEVLGRTPPDVCLDIDPYRVREEAAKCACVDVCVRLISGASCLLKLPCFTNKPTLGTFTLLNVKGGTHGWAS